jgi:hypothetical protein
MRLLTWDGDRTSPGAAGTRTVSRSNRKAGVIAVFSVASQSGP